MDKLKNVVAHFVKDESGQNLIEYALVAGIIGLGAVVTMTSLKTSIAAAFTSVTTTLNTAV